MEKKSASFSCIDHRQTAPQAFAQAFEADLSPLVAAVRELTEKVTPEVRIDLPAMNPNFTSAPVSVTVPEFPPFPEIKAPPTIIHMPEFPQIPPSQLNVSYPKLALAACAPAVVYSLLQVALSYVMAR